MLLSLNIRQKYILERIPYHYNESRYNHNTSQEHIKKYVADRIIMLQLLVL